MKTLSELIANLDSEEITGEVSKVISSIHFDSRVVEKNSIFVAIKGIEKDGHEFINEATSNGAIVIVYENKNFKTKPDLTYIKVKDSRTTLANLAKNFYNHPSKKLKLVGVTGTNGKTTTATLLYNLFKNLGYRCALLSTIENKVGDKIYPATHTTMNPVAIASFLEQAVAEGCEYAFMECSSHAIDQKRVWGLEFAGAIFTNLTQDHLDYHKTMQDYAKSKKELFDNLSVNSFAIANQDDEWGKYIISETKAKKHLISLKDKKFEQSIKGLKLSWGNTVLESKLIGKFNAYNLLGIYTVAMLLGLLEEKVIKTIKNLKPPAGRLEFISPKKGINGVIDYAHTPDALDNILKTIREMAPNKAKIITVVGCGGERDKLKRPIMGKIAHELSDYVVFSSDNPRNEDPEEILQDVVSELPQTNGKYECESDRAVAIRLAFQHAHEGDIVVLAGKGHEDYQVLKEGKVHFSDKEQWHTLSR